MQLNTTKCCGLREIDGLATAGDPQKAFLTFLRKHQERSGPFIIFSCPTKDSYGEAFKDYIEKKNIGTVFSSEEKMNPNSENLLKVYLWTVDVEACRVLEMDIKMERIAKKEEFLSNLGDRIDREATLKLGDEVFCLKSPENNDNISGAGMVAGPNAMDWFIPQRHQRGFVANYTYGTATNLSTLKEGDIGKVIGLEMKPGNGQADYIEVTVMCDGNRCTKGAHNLALIKPKT